MRQSPPLRQRPCPPVFVPHPDTGRWGSPGITPMTNRPRLVVLAGGLEDPTRCKSRANLVFRALEAVNHSVRLAIDRQQAKSGWSMTDGQNYVARAVALKPDILYFRAGGGNGSNILNEDPANRPGTGSLWNIWDAIVAALEAALPTTPIIIGKTQPSNLTEAFRTQGWAYQATYDGRGLTRVFGGGVEAMVADQQTYFIDYPSSVHFNENAAALYGANPTDSLAAMINVFVAPRTLAQQKADVAANTQHGGYGANLETKSALTGTGGAGTGTPTPTGAVASGFRTESLVG